MAKLKGPLFSLDAQNSLGKAISFVKRKVGTIAIKRPQPPDARTLAQLSWRTMYQKCSALWHTLTEAEKATWESLARPLHMTGFAYWQSQCLKPNPGIYLPLAGGTMSGAINMASQNILALPDPTNPQDADTLAARDAAITAALYTQGARVRNELDQTIPSGIYTPLTFDTEFFDTDNMHDTTVNPDRLTCHTPGIYLVTGHIIIDPTATGTRILDLIRNNLGREAEGCIGPAFDIYTSLSVATIIKMELNDYIQLVVFQDTGGDLEVYRDLDASPVFAAQRIG